MTVRTEDHAAFLGVAASQIIAVATGEYVVSTFIPALIGAMLQWVRQAKKHDLGPDDIAVSGVAAFFTGIWGGPWLAEMAPATSAAMPIMCFIAAFWARSILTGLRDVFIEAIPRILKGLIK